MVPRVPCPNPLAKQSRIHQFKQSPLYNSVQFNPTFHGGVGRGSFHAQVPRWVPLVGEVPHLQVADGESDDGGLVQLTGDGAWQWQHLGQFIKLKVLLPPPRSRRVPRLLFPQSLQPGGRTKGKQV